MLNIMKNIQPELFFTYTLNNAPWGERVARILAAAIQAVEPGESVSRHIHREKDILFVGERSYDLASYRQILVIGAGKAGAPMASATVRLLGNRFTAGVVIVKEGHVNLAQVSESVQGLSIFEASHPIPDERGAQATQRMMELASQTTPEDLVICLISGGGSALMTSPAPGITLADLQSLTSTLLACGADIQEINILRKHLDQVKGGGLARLAAPAELVTLILSDVIGDPLDAIASGPTVPDTTTFANACLVLDKYKIWEQVPDSIKKHLQGGQRGEQAETPKPGDNLFNKAHTRIIGNNNQAAQAALEQARQEGFQTMLLTTYLQGEARHAGRFLASVARQIATSGQPLNRPACLVAGGETTVTLSGDGLGGRNQELALASVTDLDGIQDVALITLATDGGDGPTNAAGAIVTGDTLKRARMLDLNPVDYLRHNDAYHFFKPLGDLLMPGATQTNVNDLAFIFAF